MDEQQAQTPQTPVTPQPPLTPPPFAPQGPPLTPPSEPAPAQTAPGKGMAVASLVLGIVALLTGFIILGGIFGIIAIILGVIAIRRKAGKGMAIAGIVMGGLGIVFGIVALFIFMLAFYGGQDKSNDAARQSYVNTVVKRVAVYQSDMDYKLPALADLPPDALTYQSEYIELALTDTGMPTTSSVVYVAGKDCMGVEAAESFSVSVQLKSGKVYCQGF